MDSRLCSCRCLDPLRLRDGLEWRDERLHSRDCGGDHLEWRDERRRLRDCGHGHLEWRDECLHLRDGVGDHLEWTDEVALVVLSGSCCGTEVDGEEQARWQCEMKAVTEVDGDFVDVEK